MTDKDIVLGAVQTLWDRLPDLVEENWDAFEERLLALLRRLDDPSEDHEKVAEEVAFLFEEFGIGTAYRKSVEMEKTRPRSGSGFESMPGRDIAGTMAFERYIKIPVYYGTDRQRIVGNKVEYTGNKGDGTLDLGVAEVSIPDDHKMGELEKPKWFKLQFKEVPEKHVMLHSVTRLDRDEFIRQARADLEKNADGQKQALVFIHGYNVTFTDALQRAAQVAYDLNFNGLSMLYSWPSHGKFDKYPADEDNAIWARPHLLAFLKLVMTELGVTDVHVIAHSMGNRVLTEVLADLEPSDVPDTVTLNQVVFAAPDVNQQTFVQLAQKFHAKAKKCTLYASSKDLALKASRKLHVDPRAGDSDPILLTDGLDTVDASGVKSDFLGHSYFGNNDSVISDLIKVIPIGTDPDSRNLDKVESRRGKYWKIKTPD